MRGWLFEQDILPRVNDYVGRSFQEALTAAEDRAKALATVHADDQAEPITEAIRNSPTSN